MIKYINLFFITCGFFINLQTKEFNLANIEMPLELLKKYEQDIDIMHPNDYEAVKNIIYLYVQALDIGIKHYVEMITKLINEQKKADQKVGLLSTVDEKIKSLFLKDNQNNLPYNLPWHLVQPCKDEAEYKIESLTIAYKIDEHFKSLSKSDRAIVSLVCRHIGTKIKEQNHFFYIMYIYFNH